MSGPTLNAPEHYAASQTKQSAEDRRHERRPLNSLVRISYCSDSPGNPHIGRGVDISDGGLAFEIGTVLDFYRLILLEFTDHAGRSCKRVARLRYRMNRTYGACFVDIEQDELSQ